MRRNGMIGKCLIMITQVSVSLISPILLCTFLGVWLDGRFGWSTTVFFVIIGFIAGGQNAYTLIKHMLKEAEKYSDYDR